MYWGGHCAFDMGEFWFIREWLVGNSIWCCLFVQSTLTVIVLACAFLFVDLATNLPSRIDIRDGWWEIFIRDQNKSWEQDAGIEPRS